MLDIYFHSKTFEFMERPSIFVFFFLPSIDKGEEGNLWRGYVVSYELIVYFWHLRLILHKKYEVGTLCCHYSPILTTW